MSYEIRAFCRPVCDQTGCDATVETLDYNWFSDMSYADDITAEQMWQTIGDDAINTLHYCPKHIHAECVECGRRETGEYLTLEGKGWDDLTDVDCTLCPDCANQPDTTTKEER